MFTQRNFLVSFATWRSHRPVEHSGHSLAINRLYCVSGARYCTKTPGRPDLDSSNLYTRLGVSKDAQAAEIKARFFELSKMHHPDVGGDTNKFRKIKESYEILSRVDKRKMYDAGYLSPDGKFTSGRFLVHFIFTGLLVCGYIGGLAHFTGMRIHDVLGLYMLFTVIAARVHRKGTRGLILALIFCWATNSMFSKSVDASLAEESVLERSVNLVGPAGARAKIRVMEGKKETFSCETSLKGVREAVNVPLRFADLSMKHDVHVHFTSGPYGLHRSHTKLTLDPIKLSA